MEINMNCLLQKEKTIQRFNYKFIALYYYLLFYNNYKNGEEKEKILKKKI